MKFFSLVLKILLALIIGLFVFAIVGLHQIKFYPTEAKLEKEFSTLVNIPSIKEIKTANATITVVDNNKDTNQVIVFIHGSPGSSQDFRKFYSESQLQNFRLIAINRIGYAKTDYGKHIVSIEKQADQYVEAIKQLIDLEDTVILVGHSYGGAPAAVVAAKLPSITKGLLLAAAPISPVDEEIFWYSKLANSKIIYALLPTSLKMATDEKMTHAEQLKAVEPFFKQVTCPVTFLQGDEDFLSPMENLEFAEKVFQNSSNFTASKIEGQSHFFPFQGREHVIDAIIQLAN